MRHHQAHQCDPYSPFTCVRAANDGPWVAKPVFSLRWQWTQDAPGMHNRLWRNTTCRFKSTEKSPSLRSPVLWLLCSWNRTKILVPISEEESSVFRNRHGQNKIMGSHEEREWVAAWQIAAMKFLWSSRAFFVNKSSKSALTQVVIKYDLVYLWTFCGVRRKG